MADAAFDTLAVLHQLQVSCPDPDQAEVIVETVRTAVAGGVVTNAMAESFGTFGTLVGMDQSCVCSPRGPSAVFSFQRTPHRYPVRPGLEMGAPCLAGTGLQTARQARLGPLRDLLHVRHQAA